MTVGPTLWWQAGHVADVLDHPGASDTVLFMARPRRSWLIGATLGAFLLAASMLVWVANTSSVEGTDAGASAATITELELCAARTDIYTCLTNLAESLPVTDPASISSFFDHVETDNKLGPFCYGAAEILGRKAWTTYGEGGFEISRPSCDTGFVHGMLFAAAQAGTPAETLAAGCSTAAAAQQAAEPWTASTMLTCLVGVGRALSVGAEDLVAGSLLCETLLANDRTEEGGILKGIDFCVRGVVVEKLDISLGVAATVKECLKLQGTRVDACFILGVRGPAAETEEAITELGDTCEIIVATYRQGCLRALSDAIAIRTFLRNLPVPQETVALCEEDIDCVGHFVKYVLGLNWNPEETLEACKIFNQRGRDICDVAVADLTEAAIRQGRIPEEGLKD